MKNWWIGLLQLIWGQASGPMRDQIVQSVLDWEAKAKETESPWDDIIVSVVKWLLAIP